MITVGIDSGNRNTKAVLLKDSRITGKAITLTGFDTVEAAMKVYEIVLTDTGVKADEIAAVAATGVGRNEIKFAQGRISEVDSAARGTRFLVSGAHTIVDLGAEEVRSIKLSPDGRIADFVINEKCAAGSGSFVESMARALQITTEQMGPLSMQHTKKVPLNAQCVVFAESEVISLIHQQIAIEDIARAVHDGVANRVCPMVRRVGIVDDIVLIGGSGRNTGLVQSLKDNLDKEIMVPEDPDYVSALGAALYAAELWERMSATTMGDNHKEEYWRWKEYNWKNPEIPDWHGCLVTAGVDIGSTSSQAVIMVDGQLYTFASMRTGSNSPGSALNAINWAMEGTGLTLQDINFTVGTGYGRVNVPFAHKTMTEIACHARGANFMFGPTVRTLLDMGGQDCKAIHCDDRGKVTSFLMNDKCAAGTGRGMEVFAELLGIPIEEVGEMSFRVDQEPEPVSSTCVVFAKTEAIRLLRSGWAKEKVLAAYCAAMANRVVSLLKRNGMEKDFAITGGIAKNSGIVKRIEKLLDVEALKPKYDTQIAGALGGALFAKSLAEKARH